MNRPNDHHLDAERIRAYRERGYLAPIRILDDADAARLRGDLEASEAMFSGRLPKPMWHKCHLLFDWADELVHHPAILDAVESLLGPDLLCWTTNLFVKEARSTSFVSWHQDAAYWGIDAADVVTAWIALSPSTPESGCLEVVPGTHHGGLIAQRDTFAKDNLLTRGQELTAPVAPGTGVPLTLAPGEMSVHHVRIVHGSGPNRSGDRRIGLAIRYIPATAGKIGRPESAMVVRGVAVEGRWIPEPRVTALSWRRRRALHNQAVRRQVVNNFRPTGDARLSTRARLTMMRLGLGTLLGVKQLAFGALVGLRDGGG